MTLDFRPAAVDDVKAACEYYDSARDGLGDDFLDELDRLIARIAMFPAGAQSVDGHEGVRRTRMRRFPFGVFYRLVGDDRIEVLRVVHSARARETLLGGDAGEE